ncbi:hypothetical protein FSP39_022490 [Pinctada imbricata]|uniref:N-acetyltransferase domain-containing protein n=1 Tax=Pinctada imbricata TaxID=66713 RepID=A0AA89C801_PINIB|nr:hypothetical protein FSP39_022490 [Pinctada imbricata]
MNEAPVITEEPTSISDKFPERNNFFHSDGPVSIRHLTDTPDDRAFAARLTVEAFREKAVHATSERSIPKFIESLTNHMQDQAPQYYERNFIAEHNGERAGLVAIKCHGDLAESLFCMESATLDSKSIPRGKCYVDHICVDENFRGKGIGKVLMEFCDIEARRIGCKSIFLDVSTTNRARNLYERQGYEIQDTVYGCCWSYRCTIGVKVSIIRVKIWKNSSKTTSLWLQKNTPARLLPTTHETTDYRIHTPSPLHTTPLTHPK